MKRNSFSNEFKKQAVTLVTEEDRSILFVSRSLGTHVNTLYRWVS